MTLLVANFFWGLFWLGLFFFSRSFMSLNPTIQTQTSHSRATLSLVADKIFREIIFPLCKSVRDLICGGRRKLACLSQLRYVRVLCYKWTRGRNVDAIEPRTSPLQPPDPGLQDDILIVVIACEYAKKAVNILAGESNLSAHVEADHEKTMADDLRIHRNTVVCTERLYGFRAMREIETF